MPQIAAPESAADPLPDVAPARRPRHIAVIMDGNGRWAVQRSLPRIAGHRAGAKAVRDIVVEAARLGLDALTLYSFSLENWKRPADEITSLMSLYVEYLVKERSELLEHNVRFIHLGRADRLPKNVLAEMQATIEATRECTGLTLALALNYGSRAEITDAVQNIARAVETGSLTADEITERTISDALYTAGLPDPDLLIRTAGEMRVSNYLLWQISYAEIHVTDVLWPDFRVEHLHTAIREYASRNRRYGAVDASNS